jgi:hypothetical protein
MAFHIFWGRDIISRPETAAFAGISKVLSEIGFNPSNPSVFPAVLKVGWVITITNFSLIELVSMFFLYIPTFPILMLLFYFFRKEFDTSKYVASVKPGLAPSRQPKGLSKIAVAALVGWFVLYGDSYNILPLCLGVILAGFLFITRSFSAFIYARPIDERKSKFIDGFAEVVTRQATNELQKLTDKTFKKKSEIKISVKFLKGYQWCARNLAWFMRGQRGRSRAALWVLMQYMATLLVLGATAVLFWGLMIRLYTLPSHIDMIDALMASASHILPGLNAPTSLPVPTWIQVASSVSAWILFVIYAGPAASVFPTLQQTYMRAIDGYYLKLRSAYLALLRSIRLLELSMPSLQ